MVLHAPSRIPTFKNKSGKVSNLAKGLVMNLAVTTGAKAKNILIFLANWGKPEKAMKAGGRGTHKTGLQASAQGTPKH